jgi:hypothetical protein
MIGAVNVTRNFKDLMVDDSLLAHGFHLVRHALDSISFATGGDVVGDVDAN